MPVSIAFMIETNGHKAVMLAVGKNNVGKLINDELSGVTNFNYKPTQ